MYYEEAGKTERISASGKSWAMKAGQEIEKLRRVEYTEIDSDRLIDRHTRDGRQAVSL